MATNFPHSDNLQPPSFGPHWPIYPQIMQVVRVADVAVANTVIYPAKVQQHASGSFRDRESCYLKEANGQALDRGIYVSRLIDSYVDLPLYVTHCCPGAGTVGGGPANFSFTASGGGAAFATGGGTASFSFTASGGGSVTGTTTGSGSASVSFTAIAGSGGQAIFLSSGTWVAQKTSALIECYGPGGASPGVAQAAFGGGGGAYASKTQTGLTIGNSYTVHVGMNAGDDTYFIDATTVMAKAGTDAQINLPGQGGAAADSVGTTKWNGRFGGAPMVAASGGGGGGAISTAQGTPGENGNPPNGGAGGVFGGGKGADSDALNGANGTQPGGGAGGAGAFSYVGGFGEVIITW